ncbi:MAG TPA: SxtJ family membrane protein [Pyrinomonadaceae bacterium]
MIKQTVTDAQARKSALLVGGVLAAIAAWNFYRGRMTVVAVLGAISLALFLIGLLLPPAARAFHNGWMTLAGVLGYINSRILLFLMFYGIITPFGLVAKLLGHDPLNRRAVARESYWIKRERTRQSREGFERLF